MAVAFESVLMTVAISETFGSVRPVGETVSVAGPGPRAADRGTAPGTGFKAIGRVRTGMCHVRPRHATEVFGRHR
ncbi:hypothetical protein A6E15_09695 [Natrinema saccharevitans]|uniref:Uncharacterized protein n=1 Tax=Natrinema saccharevitans TaxID=301967 RepID=A0A1S8AX04_9EURY|nr:hypothetical protein A6E15_09695 [Natrinema saccharevitans]